MRRHFFSILACGVFSLLFLIPSGCSKKTQNPSKNFTVVVATPQTAATALHFSGILAPLQTQPVFSPLNAHVNHIFFQYGQFIARGQILLTIDAINLANDYRKAVSDFLEKKQAYETGLMSFEGTQALYHAGVISKEEYLTQENSQKSDTLRYYQAKYDLEKLLAQVDFSSEDIEKLRLADIEKVNQVLNRKFKTLEVRAPVSGIILFPSEKSDSSAVSRLSPGDELKAGQLILSIGDLSGLSMKINVSEININLIKPGLPAKITGDAFPNMELPGSVVYVASQANPQSGDGSSGASLFEVVIQIPNLSPAQRKIIHVGMNAQAELDIPGTPQIYLPIRAVFEKDGQKMVSVLDKSNHRHDVPVITGQTTLTGVAIVQGLSEGDRVVVPH